MHSNLRLNWSKLAPKSFEAFLSVNATLESSTLGKVLIDLVFARVSQINGCAYCLDMHVRDLRKHGEQWQRINSLSTWRRCRLRLRHRRHCPRAHRRHPRRCRASGCSSARFANATAPRAC